MVIVVLLIVVALIFTFRDFRKRNFLAGIMGLSAAAIIPLGWLIGKIVGDPNSPFLFLALVPVLFMGAVALFLIFKKTRRSA